MNTGTKKLLLTLFGSIFCLIAMMESTADAQLLRRLLLPRHRCCPLPNSYCESKTICFPSNSCNPATCKINFDPELNEYYIQTDCSSDCMCMIPVTEIPIPPGVDEGYDSSCDPADRNTRLQRHLHVTVRIYGPEDREGRRELWKAMSLQRPSDLHFKAYTLPLSLNHNNRSRRTSDFGEWSFRITYNPESGTTSRSPGNQPKSFKVVVTTTAENGDELEVTNYFARNRPRPLPGKDFEVGRFQLKVDQNVDP